FGDSPTAVKSREPMFVERIETPLGAMIAVADDEGLRLLEFTDRRATERELSILRTRLRTSVVPGEHPHREAIRSRRGAHSCGRKNGCSITKSATRPRSQDRSDRGDQISKSLTR